jgi:hypothetical protein
MKKRFGASRNMKFEALERREMMAGNVVASVDQGLLKVIGDNLANDVEVRSGSQAGEFIITGTNNTHINGGSKPVTLRGVTQGVQAIMNGGDDHLNVGRAPTTSTTSIVPTSVPGPFGLGIDLGSGNDVLYVRNTNVAGSCGISGQDGNDKVYVYDKSKFAQDLIIDTANGDDFVGVNNKSTAARYLMVGTGAGNDEVRLDGAGAAWIYAHLGDGNDVLTVTKCQSALQPGFDGGNGKDKKTIKNDNIFPVPANCINFEI